MTAYTPNLPALITALPGDAARAPQTEFDRARQVLFLENLSVTGSVRSAAAAGGVSHQTAYRARRSTPAFRTAWDAALLVARAAAADVLRCRAIDGVEEKVFYHGEEVATRTRFSDRLLLAHLARLDRLVENPAANAFAEDWDESVARFERGEPQPVSGPEQAAEKNSLGPCNTRSMSYTPGAQSYVPRFDDDLARDMQFERPIHAPTLGEFADPAAAELCQREMFETGAEEWWRHGEDYIPYVADAAGRWVPDPEELAWREELAAEAERDGAAGEDEPGEDAQRAAAQGCAVRSSATEPV